jgi:release factor glutamine methyltransferase
MGQDAALTLGEALAQGVARLEAEVLLAAVTGLPRTALFAWPERELAPAQEAQWRQWLERRLAGEPLAYILGRREFWSLELEVGPEVLIPRPETEHLVELGLERMPADAKGAILDLGTGSGAIAAAMASERPGAHILATDASAAALRLAGANFQRLGLTNIQTRLGNWCQALRHGETFDLILANPPYVAEGDPHLLQGDLPAEPVMALVSGSSGLEALTAICDCAPRHLQAGGWLLLEHGYTQAKEVRALLARAGLEQVQSWPDLAGIERVSGGQYQHQPNLL